MRTHRARLAVRALVVVLLCSVASPLRAQESGYRVKPVYTPPLVRPRTEVVRDSLPRSAAGTMPTFDGDAFHVNLAPGSGAATDSSVRALVLRTIRAFEWRRDDKEIVLARRQGLRSTDSRFLDEQIKRGESQTRERESGRLGRLGTNTERAIQDRSAALRRQGADSQSVIVFDQRVNGVRVEQAGVVAHLAADRGVQQISGRVFGIVELGNQPVLDSTRGVAAAKSYVGRFTKVIAADSARPELVLLPYGSVLRYAWRVDVPAEEGTYRLWIDAQNERVLQLEPLFSSDGASGLVFDPDPNTGTDVQSFEIDAASGGVHRLRLTGTLDVNNAGADGISSGDLTIAGTDFNTSPFNGTTVDRTGSTGYNSRFQEINGFGWIFYDTKLMEALGSQTFPSITATVNHNNPCGFGINNACGGGSSVTFGIGSATTSTSTSTSDLFNTAIDATVVTHEWGHVFTGLQMAVGGGSAPSALKEGLSDFWAATIHNNSIFGGWWARNSTTPVQTGFVPRQAEQRDVFPEHRAFSTDGHADGQIIDWALWETRRGLNGLSVLGTLSINMSLLKALTGSGVGVVIGTTDKRVHDSFVNLLQQLTAQYNTSSDINKLLAGFARAGMTLSERDAIIDINDDYLARSGPAPTFTIWTGRDYQFNATETAVATNVFNTRFTVEVANDAAFTTNLVSSGVQTGVAVSTNGVPMATWTLPAANWNTLKSGNFLFYRVTTTDNAAGNSRSSLSPGNGFIASVPAPSAVINESGECGCATATADTIGGRGATLLMLLPIVVALFWRRRLRRLQRGGALVPSHS